jgi:tetratricopeptide (TPR) repeat protein
MWSSMAPVWAIRAALISVVWVSLGRLRPPIVQPLRQLLSYVLRVLDRLQEAQQLAQRAALIAPHSEAVRLLLANLAIDQKDLPIALQCAQRTLELAPQSVLAHSNMPCPTFTYCRETTPYSDHLPRWLWRWHIPLSSA